MVCKIKKIKAYKREKLDLFLKNPLISNYIFLEKLKKDIIKKDNFFINTHYSDQLKEKRKIKLIYGITNKKYNIYYNNSKNKGNIFYNIFKILEFRFDNIIYRSGFSCTRKEAKQMISHGYFRLNNNNFNYSSKILKVGDYISLNYSKKNFFRKKYFNFFVKNNFFPNWIFLNENKTSLYLKRYPSINDMNIYLSYINSSNILSNCY